VNFKILYLLLLFISFPNYVYAMHIGEGMLPPAWSLFYFVLSLPFIYLGLKSIRKKTMSQKDLKLLLGLVAAFCFILSALKLPSVTGSSSHPTGTGFSAILFGPIVTSVISTIVLLFQAIFLGHGGITTLGANVFSMGIAGPFAAFLVYKIVNKKSNKLAIFLGAAIGDLTTYIVTSFQLALAFPDKSGGILISFGKFASIFAITQVPIAIIEGILTVIIFNFANRYAASDIKTLRGETSEW
jgi:cobalt/nickel transport system permease protein